MEKINCGLSIKDVQSFTGLLGTKGILKINDETLVDNYPFNPLKEVPVEVISETAYFLTCKVLAHQNPTPMSCGMSKDYSVTVDKFNLLTKKIEIVSKEYPS